MPNNEKVERVARLKERIEGSSALLLTEYRGLTVSEISELRRSLRESGTSFAVIKNTLMSRAAADAGLAELGEMLTGPSAIAFVDGDPVAAAKAIKAATKQYPALVLKGGYMDGAVLDDAGANRLADLESREVMLSKIAGMLKSELSHAAALFVGAQSKFLATLEAFKAKLPAEEPASEAGVPAGAEAPAEADAPEAEEPAAETEPAADADEPAVPEASDDTNESTEEE
jgi:large subunit ribosomal protein L10